MTTHAPQIRLHEAPTPPDAQRHRHRVRHDQTPRSQIEDPEGQEPRRCERAEEGDLPDGLAGDLRVGGDDADEGFQDAVDGEEGDVVAVRGQDARGLRVGPTAAGDEAEEGGREGGAERGGEEGEEEVEAEEGGEVGFGLGEDGVVFVFGCGLGSGETAEEGAGGFFDWLEDDAGEEAAVIGGESVSALGREGCECCDEVTVAVCEELVKDVLAIESSRTHDKRAGEAGDEVV